MLINPDPLAQPVLTFLRVKSLGQVMPPFERTVIRSELGIVEPPDGVSRERITLVALLERPVLLQKREGLLFRVTERDQNQGFRESAADRRKSQNIVVVLGEISIPAVSPQNQRHIRPKFLYCIVAPIHRTQL